VEAGVTIWRCLRNSAQKVRREYSRRLYEAAQPACQCRSGGAPVTQRVICYGRPFQNCLPAFAARPATASAELPRKVLRGALMAPLIENRRVADNIAHGGRCQTSQQVRAAGQHRRCQMAEHTLRTQQECKALGADSEVQQQPVRGCRVAGEARVASKEAAAARQCRAAQMPAQPCRASHRAARNEARRRGVQTETERAPQPAAVKCFCGSTGLPEAVNAAQPRARVRIAALRSCQALTRAMEYAAATRPRCFVAGESHKRRIEEAGSAVRQQLGGMEGSGPARPLGSSAVASTHRAL